MLSVTMISPILSRSKNSWSILAGAFGEAAGEHLRNKDLIAKSYWQRFLEFLQSRDESGIGDVSN